MKLDLAKIKKLAIIIAILIVLIIIIVVWIHFSNKKGTSEEEKATEFEMQESYEVEENIEKVKNRNKYYTVKTLIERYITYLNDLKDEKTEDEIRNLTTKAVTDVLDKTYKQEYDINDQDIEKLYNEISEDEVIEIKDMYFVEKSASSNLFLVYGTMKVSQKDFQIMVRTDSSQMRFSIFPEEYMKQKNYSYESKKEDFDTVFSEPIEENEYNKFKFVSISEEKMAVEYFNDMKKKLLSNANISYELLDEEYRNKRFENQENFEQYLQNYKKDLSKIEIKGYQVENKEDFKLYTCKDQFDNIYTFKETAIHEYTIKLDRYTIKDDEFKQIYKKSSEQEKVATNIDIWIQMINSRDYKAAYQVLDETFRNNYFESLEDFTSYMQQYFPAHYKIEFGDFNEEAKVYTQQVTFINMENEEEPTFDRSFVMQLKEEENFVMSMNLFKH